MQQKETVIPTLDGVRGLSCIIVLLVHSMGHFPGWNFDINFRDIGRPAVTCFFVLSGHLLSYHYLSEHCSFAHLRTFFIRRFFRIYPLFALVVLLAYLIQYKLPGSESGVSPFSWEITLKHLLLLRGTAHFWTVQTEMWFYALLPLFAVIAVLLRLRAKSMLLFLAAIYIVNVIVAYPLPQASSKVIRFLPFFTAGVITGYVQRQGYTPRLKPGHYDAIMVVCSLLLVLGAFNYLPFVQVEHRKLFHRSAWFFAPIFALLVLSVHQAGWLTRQIYANRFIRFTGLISYSLYLIHPFVYALVSTLDWPVHLRLATGVALTFLASWGLYRLIEKPCNRLGRKFSRRWA